MFFYYNLLVKGAIFLVTCRIFMFTVPLIKILFYNFHNRNLTLAISLI